MNQDTKDKWWEGLIWFALAVGVICLALLSGGCSAPREIEKVYVHDTLYQNKVVHDSVDRWHTHYEFIKGDTLHSIDTFYQDRWHLRTDTLYQTNVVTETKTEVVEVEKKVYVWWPFALGSILLIVVVLFRKNIISWIKELIAKIK